MGQNLFKLFSNDPVEYNLKQVRSQLGIMLITHIRVCGWTHQAASSALDIDAESVARLMEGYLEGFTIDTLMTLLVRAGYTLGCEFVPDEMATRMVIDADEGK
jgi:predicted XRE-type DNA-binding protein